MNMMLQRLLPVWEQTTAVDREGSDPAEEALKVTKAGTVDEEGSDAAIKDFNCEICGS